MLKIECNMKLEQTTTKNKYKIKYLYIREFIYICYFYWRRIFVFYNKSYSIYREKLLLYLYIYTVKPLYKTLVYFQ